MEGCEIMSNAADLGPRNEEVKENNGSLYSILTKEFRCLGVKKEDIIRVRFEAERRDGMGRRLTPKRIIIEAIE